jgi:hypothetical protein
MVFLLEALPLGGGVWSLQSDAIVRTCRGGLNQRTPINRVGRRLSTV